MITVGGMRLKMQYLQLKEMRRNRGCVLTTTGYLECTTALFENIEMHETTTSSR